MIKVKVNDSIIDIIEKIECEDTQQDISLDFPLGHPILHNYISLKILKSKVGSKRKLIIATSDSLGRKVGRNLGIYYTLSTKLTPSNEQSKNILHHNYNFYQYFLFLIKSYISEIKIFLENTKKTNTIYQKTEKLSGSLALQIFGGFFLFSFLIFLGIFYFIVSKTYVYITPEIVVKKEVGNFIFKENIGNTILGSNTLIEASQISQNIQIKELFFSTGIEDSSAQRSEGIITLKNLSDEQKNLIAGTRLQLGDIIFRLERYTQIPPAVYDNFGELQPGVVRVKVISDFYDISGVFVGSRGNIKQGVTLNIPGLSSELQEVVFGETHEDFTGGSDDYQKQLLPEDIQRAEAIMIEKLKTIALEELRQEIILQNTKNGENLGLITGGTNITYENIILTLEEGVEAYQTRDRFTVEGNLTITGYTYDKEHVIQKLRLLLGEKILPGVEKISYIDKNSLRIAENIYSQKSPFETKSTFEVEAFVFHDFLHSDNGYFDILKRKIRSLPIDDAEKILLNDPKISKVEIRNQPFFSKNVSHIFNNIVLDIK